MFIAPDRLGHVFEEFKTAKGSTRGGGVGLGLSLVKRLIELHGGEVLLDSSPGKGTTVTCRLPMTPLAAAEKHTVGQVESVSGAAAH